MLTISCQMNDQDSLNEASRIFDQWIEGTLRLSLVNLQTLIMIYKRAVIKKSVFFSVFPSWPADLQQRSCEPQAAGVSVRHEELWFRGKVEYHVSEVQRLHSGPGEGQAAVRAGFGGGRQSSL